MKEFFQYKIQTVLNIQKIVTIHYFEFPENYSFKGEVHDFWELVYCDSSEVLVSQDGTDTLLTSGEMAMHRPNVFHKISANNKPCSVFIISFVCNSKALYNLGETGAVYKLDAAEKNYISEIISEADKTFALPAFHNRNKKMEMLETPVFGGMQMIKLNLESMFIHLLRSMQHISRLPERPLFVQTEASETIVNAIKDYLSRNVYNQINLDDIAYGFGYGKTFLCTRFKDSTGLPILKYFTQLKIKEAKKLIRENKYTFSQISDMLNFSSPSHFAAVFKKYANSSLTQYKNSIKK